MRLRLSLVPFSGSCSNSQGSSAPLSNRLDADAPAAEAASEVRAKGWVTACPARGAKSRSLSSPSSPGANSRAAYANPHGGRTPGAPSPLTPYSARIEQLHSTATKAVESAASSAINSAPTSAVASSSPSLSPFRERINDW
ncbi:unnamed protein product [Closterium sp. Naga37s-1]|nr:unnamed protein product [Closterium sp. Naga37s-1]